MRKFLEIPRDSTQGSIDDQIRIKILKKSSKFDIIHNYKIPKNNQNDNLQVYPNPKKRIEILNHNGLTEIKKIKIKSLISLQMVRKINRIPKYSK